MGASAPNGKRNVEADRGPKRIDFALVERAVLELDNAVIVHCLDASKGGMLSLNVR